VSADRSCSPAARSAQALTLSDATVDKWLNWGRVVRDRPFLPTRWLASLRLVPSRPEQGEGWPACKSRTAALETDITDLPPVSRMRSATQAKLPSEDKTQTTLTASQSKPV